MKKLDQHQSQKKYHNLDQDQDQDQNQDQDQDQEQNRDQVQDQDQKFDFSSDWGNFLDIHFADQLTRMSASV